MLDIMTDVIHGMTYDSCGTSTRQTDVSAGPAHRDCIDTGVRDSGFGELSIPITRVHDHGCVSVNVHLTYVRPLHKTYAICVTLHI